MDLLTPVINHLKEVNKYNFDATFLFQYDALLKKEFVSVFDDIGNNIEIGGWLEIVKPLVDKCNIRWSGRENFDWDWHAHCDLLLGYSLQEREILIDEYMTKFKSTFGYFPKVVGAWMLDAYSVNYLFSKYGITAILICREQCGTDGYTLWGGFYNGIYYPSKYNVLCPANSLEEQINVPVIRMLGIDPINSYDGFLFGDTNTVTLEPICKNGGNNEEWIKWYFNQTFFIPTLSYSYAQTGQENSFGWDYMYRGLSKQYQFLNENLKEQDISIEKVSETGKWYSKNFSQTIPYTYKNPYKTELRPRNSFWYNSRYYRANLVIKDNVFFIRDIFLFDSKYRERYFDKVCTTDDAYLDNLPVIDGFNWSENKENFAGLFPINKNGNIIVFLSYDYEEKDNGFTVRFFTEEFGNLYLDFKEKTISATCEKNAESLTFIIKAVVNKEKAKKISTNSQFNFSSQEMDVTCELERETVKYKYNNYNYALRLTNGKIINNKIIASDKKIYLEMVNILR